MFPEPSPRVAALRTQLAAFMDEHVYPHEATFHDQLAAVLDRVRDQLAHEQPHVREDVLIDLPVELRERTASEERRLCRSWELDAQFSGHVDYVPDLGDF